MQRLKSILIGRGRAFAPPSRNSPPQSSFANALPSLLFTNNSSLRFGFGVNVEGLGQSIPKLRLSVN